MMIYGPLILAIALLALFFLLSIASAIRSAIWWHWSNENELAPGRLGSPIRHGRAWVHVHEGRRFGGSAFHVEWILLKFSGFGIRFGAGRDDGTEIGGHACLGFGAVYWGVQSRVFRKWLPEEGRSFRVAIHDGAIWFGVWERELSMRTSDPWWVRGVSFNPADFFLGEADYSKRMLEHAPVMIPMPERAYSGQVSVFECTWKRPRWPFSTRLIRAHIEMDDGEQIPIPGKGENSWDCGQDATYGLTTVARTIPEAVGAMVERVIERRQRYGGRAWVPEEIRQ